MSGMLSGSRAFSIGFSYGRVLMLASILFSLAAFFSVQYPDTMLYYCFSAIGCGVQNGMITKYSGGVIRTTNVTGGMADVGGILGRMIKGNFADSWQLKVLLPIISSFIFGGMIGKVTYQELEEYAPIVNAAFMVCLTMVYVISVKVVSQTELSLFQLLTGKYTFPQVRDTIARGQGVFDM